MNLIINSVTVTPNTIGIGEEVILIISAELVQLSTTSKLGYGELGKIILNNRGDPVPIENVKVSVAGTTVDAILQGDGTYKATLAAPNTTSYNVNDGHYYPITIIATNKAGTSVTVNDQSENIGGALRLRVLERTAPTLEVVHPSGYAYYNTATPTLEFYVYEEADGSGIALNNLVVYIDDTFYNNVSSNLTISKVTNGYKVLCVPNSLSEGSHTFKVKVSDNDGNLAESSEMEFFTDTVAPALSITYPPYDETYVNTSEITVMGTASDASSGVSSVTVKLNDGNERNATRFGDSFSMPLALIPGTNTIVVTVKDHVGRTRTITRTVILDESQPVIGHVSIDPNPVGVGQTYTVSIEVTG